MNDIWNTPPAAIAPAKRIGEAMAGRDASAVQSKPAQEKQAPRRSNEDWAWIMGWVGHVDEEAHKAEATWGIDRLPRIVPVEMSAKFYLQASKYQEALRTGSRADVEWEAGRMMNAWKALSLWAIEHGQNQLAPSVWKFEALDKDKSKVGIYLVQTRAEAKALVDTLKGEDQAAHQIWTVNEVANLISGFPDLVATKKVFPGAEVTNVRVKPPVDWTIGDDMPENMGGSPMGDLPIMGD